MAGSTEVDGGDDPYTEYVANATGQGVELTMPGVLQFPDVGCDEDAYRIWNAELPSIRSRTASTFTWGCSLPSRVRRTTRFARSSAPSRSTRGISQE